ncbi:MAG: FkbM family methyltransferase [Elusimicrobiota bacterium]
MLDFIAKVRIVLGWLKNIKIIVFLREFVIFYLQRIVELKNLPESKKYLLRIPGIIGVYTSRQFLYYAPVYLERYVKKIAGEIFEDSDSRELYYTVFARNIYSSHFLPGFEEYYEPEEEYNRKLTAIKSEITGKIEFKSNFFTSKTKKGKYPALNFANGESYVLPINWFELSVFSFHMGLKIIPGKYLDYIKDKYIVDGGAFVGDSSIVLAQYTTKKVLAIEPGAENYKRLQITPGLNQLRDKIDTFNVALDEKKRTIKMLNHGAGSRVISLDSKSEGSIGTKTLDELTGETYKGIGLIKLDVEGFEMNILLGSQGIIRRDKPVLLISIYHSGEQYLNIPTYFKEKYSDIYDFKFIDTNPVHPLAEKVFVCLPKQI